MVTDSLLMRFVPAAGASAVVGLVVATRPLGTIPRALALACVVGAWGAAVLFRRNEIRAHATVVAGIAAVTAAGQVQAGIPYGVACILFLFGCLASMRAARTSAGELRRLRAPPGVLVVLVVTATVIAGGLVTGLPRLAERVERRLTAMFGGDGDQATAFSTTMVLGSTRGMLQSDAIVMRIDGERPEYLRGAVYDRYDAPFWITTGRGRTRTPVVASAQNAADTTRITLVRGTPNGEDMRWFLPVGACDLGVASGHVEIDGFGVARRPRGEDPPTLTYRTASCTTAPSLPAPPAGVDLDLPPRVRRSLTPIAAGWTASATTPREKLNAIGRELARFEYSLAVPRDVGLDPVVDFITVHRAGHCELFASAMVLLARTQGIPARVIGGYRVTEVNPLTGKAVVRDRNAHAWVEAWVDGAWRGWDPTPESESLGSGPKTADHLADVLASAFDYVVVSIAKLGALGVAGVLTIVIVLLLIVRWIDTHLHTRRGRRQRARENALPLPCFETLTAELAKAGHVRIESEPLEAFARRLGAAAAPWAHDVSRALFEYADLRYGGLGDETAVVGSVERATRSVRAGG